jgi:hypothetical protein
MLLLLFVYGGAGNGDGKGVRAGGVGGRIGEGNGDVPSSWRSRSRLEGLEVKLMSISVGLVPRLRQSKAPVMTVV